MVRPFKAEYRDPGGYLDIEYDRRIGYFSMATDHLHDHYELYYLLSGERIYFIKDRSYRVMAGDLVFVDRNAVHKTLDSGWPDHDRVVLYISPGLFGDLSVPPELAETLLEPFRWEVPLLRLPTAEGEAIRRMVDEMVDEMVRPQAGSGQLLRHRALELLLQACRSRHLGQVRPADTEPALHPKAQAIVQYLNRHYQSPVTLTGVAADFRISPYYLSRLFKQMTGFTFSDYVNLLRIKEAQRLLRESGDSVTDVALHAGFGNFSHFGKVFKRTVGMSPREYRRQYRP